MAMDRNEAKRRFEAVMLDKAIRKAERYFRKWPERKRDDAIQEFLTKCLDTWMRAADAGKDPEMDIGCYQIMHWAWMWVRYDRKVAGRSRNGPDVYDYRVGMKRQELNGQGQASPTDKGSPENEWINWRVGQSREVDPAEWAEARDEWGLL